MKINVNNTRNDRWPDSQSKCFVQKTSDAKDLGWTQTPYTCGLYEERSDVKINPLTYDSS